MEDEKKKIVARAIIECAHNIGINTTIEGVENGLIRTKLQEYGATFLQGYHYSKPIPIDEFTKLELFSN